MSETALITEIERFALNDGPGIRTTVFFKGCNLHCSWCHNPETIRQRQDLHYHEDKCIGCYKCVYACPSKAQKRINNEHRYYRNICVQCGKCADICYAGAMEVSGKRMAVEEVMSEIIQDQSYYRTSKGGVTLSGGEVFCQKEFASALTDACHDAGIHVGAETNLCFPWEAIEDTVRKLDLIMCDLKIFDTKEHGRWTGAGNELILENIRKLSECGIPFIVRTPLIPGATDSDENIDEIASFLSELESSSMMYYELLNFNPLGHSKYKSLGKKNPFQEARPLPAKRLEELKQRAAAKGISVRTE